MLTWAKNLSLLKQFTYMNLKVLITVFQNIIWFCNISSSISNTNIFKTFSHNIVNNNIFWKCVTRSFRCIYVNCFNILRFFAEVSTKLRKCTFSDNLRIISQEGNMETTQMTPLFSSNFSALPVCNIHFWISKYLKFTLKFITLVHSCL